MKVIVAGSRSITDLTTVLRAVKESGFEVTEVVAGGCRGVDQLAEHWAGAMRYPFRRFPADWQKHGKRAGPIRNEEMACYADALVAVWDGKSRGTHDMIRKAEAKGLKIWVHHVGARGPDNGGGG